MGLQVCKKESVRVESFSRTYTDILPLEWAIGSLGLGINVFYFGYKYFRTGFSGQIGGDIVGYALIFSTIPLFAFIGQMLRQERRNRSQIAELKEITNVIVENIQSDLATSVRFIKDGAKWLEKTGVGDEKSRVVELIKNEIDCLEDATRNASKLAGLINGLEDFTYTDLGKYIDCAVKEVNLTAEEKRIHVHCELDRTYTAWCSPAIKDVFAQLLTNAIKSSKEDSGVTIKLEDAGSHWRMALSDFRDRTAHANNEADFYDGSGLGSAVVKKIVGIHGGRIWIEDNTPMGRTVNIALPKRKTWL